jgi:hypothetical protein
MSLSHLRAALLGALCATALFIVAGLPLYVFPQVDEPQKTDVIYVIGPPTETRMAVANRMLEAGLSDTLMISTPSPEDYKLCDPRPDITVICVKPDPSTTQGESQDLGEMAAKHGWKSATVITFTPHITRTRVLMERCYSGDLRMVADETPLWVSTWVYHYLYQTGAFIKVALTPAC